MAILPSARECQERGGLGRHRRGARFRRVGIVAHEIADAQIVAVYVLPRTDRLAGEADDLAIAPDRLAGGQRPRRHLVAGRNQSGNGHRFAGDVDARDQLVQGHDHVVARMQADDASRFQGAVSLLGMLCFPG